jgi:hypothetical protein
MLPVGGGPVRLAESGKRGGMLALLGLDVSLLASGFGC